MYMPIENYLFVYAKELGSFPYHIARILTARLIFLDHSIPSILLVRVHSI